MDKFSILPTIKIYSAGAIWWLWFIYQPMENDMGLTLILFTVIFYFVFLNLLIKSEHKVILLLVTLPLSISISIIIIGTLWYLTSLSLGIT